jgi:aspartyl/asparaginyl-tRNA synthetase
MKATAVHLIGGCNQETYPLQKKRHSLAYLRSIPHLRPRTNTFGAVTRVRSALAFATHQFFRESGFQYIHTPILSASDCEGAGEMFQVSFTTCMYYALMLPLTISIFLTFSDQERASIGGMICTSRALPGADVVTQMS